MKLLVVVLCLLSERFLIHSASYQRFIWFNEYSQHILDRIKQNNYFSNPWIQFAAIVLPLILLVSIIYALFHTLFFGFGGLILSVLLFYYCLGPQNPFYPSSQSDSIESGEQEAMNYFANVNSQLFAILFWYLLLGPLVAFTYRLISLSRPISQVSDCANQVADILEWIPARITMILFLLAGNFQKGFGYFMQHFISTPDINNKIIAECGLLAVQPGNSEEVSLPIAENLVEYGLIVFLVFIAFFTLVAWI